MNISHVKRTPAAKLAAVAALSAIAFSCVKLPTEPMLPQSTIQMTIPIVNRTRYISDFFGKDTSTVKSDAGGGYYYEDDRSFTPRGIDTIKATPQPGSNTVSIGRLTLPGLPGQVSSFTAGQLGLPPMTYPIFPGGNITLPGVSMQDTADFDFIAVSSGNMTISVTNNMPTALSFPNPLVIKNNKLSAPVDTSVIATFLLGSVPPGQTQVTPASLNGILMRGAIQTGPITIQVASSSGPETVTSSSGVSFTFGTTQLLVDSASAKIPEQNLLSVSDSTITLDSTAVLQEALFTRGRFALDVNNQTGLRVGAQMKFSNFVRSIPPFDTLTVDTVILGHTNFNYPLNLADFRVVNGVQGVGGGTALRFSLAIKTVSSKDPADTTQFLKSTVTKDDFVHTGFIPQGDVALKSLKGWMNPMTLNINTGVGMSGLGASNNKFAGSFSYDSVAITLRFKFNDAFPIAHNLRLLAFKKTPTFSVDSLTITPGTIDPTSLGGNNSIVLSGPSLNNFLSSITPNLPDSFAVHGTVVLNPGGKSGPPGSVSDTTKVYPEISTYIPLKLGLVGGKYEDVMALEGKMDSNFVANVQSGRMYFSITNGLPIALNFRTAFLKYNTVSHKNDTLLWMPQSQNGNVYGIPGAGVDNSGAVNLPRSTAFSISMDTTDVRHLNEADSVFVLMTVNTSGNNSTTPVQAVRIRASDFISFRASANMVFILKEQKR